jgi:ribosomal protein S18 acetylase RimI-like enzyme
VTDIKAASQEAEAVRKATEDEIPGLASILARAFYDDPVFSWLLPDEGRRLATQERLFSLLLRRLMFRQGESYTTDGLAGTAIWESPGQWKVGALEQLSLLPAMVRILGRRTPRVVHALTMLEFRPPEAPHFYLPFLGVAPEWQGRGIGSALLRPVLGRCEDEGLGAYLEASSSGNRALYERHGFEVTDELKVTGDAPPWWCMWREPGG